MARSGAGFFVGNSLSAFDAQACIPFRSIDLGNCYVSASIEPFPTIFLLRKSSTSSDISSGISSVTQLGLYQFPRNLLRSCMGRASEG